MEKLLHYKIILCLLEEKVDFFTSSRIPLFTFVCLTWKIYKEIIRITNWSETVLYQIGQMHSLFIINVYKQR